MSDTELFQTINNAQIKLMSLEDSSLDSVNTDIDDSEGSDSEEDAEADARSISADQLNYQSSTETSFGSSANTASSNIDSLSIESTNIAAVSSGDSFSSSDIRLRPRSQEARDLQNNQLSSHRDLGNASIKGRLTSRWKFWSVFAASGLTALLVFGVSVGANVLATWINRKLAAKETVPPITPKPDTTKIPDDLKKLLAKEAEIWSKMDSSEAFTRMRDMVKGFTLSLQAQLLMMTDLKRLTEQPKGLPKEWDEKVLTKLENAVFLAYQNSDKPKDVAIYNQFIAKDSKTPSPLQITFKDAKGNENKRPLSVHEAADVCDYVISKILVFLKASNNAVHTYAAKPGNDPWNYQMDLVTRNSDLHTAGSASMSLNGLGLHLASAGEHTEQLCDDARREIDIRRKKALKYWKNAFPPLSGENIFHEEITALDEDHPTLDHKKGTLVLHRISDRGGAIFLLGGLVISLDGENAKLTIDGRRFAKKKCQGSSALPRDSLVLAATSLSGDQVGGEIGNVASMIGMMAIPANPVVGGVLMVGGQIAGWIFGMLGKAKKTALPDANEIKIITADQHVQNLVGEANSVWRDLKAMYKSSWAAGFLPDQHTLDQFQKVVKRGANLESPNTVHDNTNQIMSLVEEVNAKKELSGAHNLPAFTWSACIEILCLQHASQILMAQTNCGKGKDTKLNKAYRDSLEDLDSRFNELNPWLKNRIVIAQKASAKRMGQVTSIVKGYRLSAGGIQNRKYTATDSGTFPMPSKSNPVVEHDYSFSRGCCGNHDDPDKVQYKKAVALLDDYLKELTTAVDTEFGLIKTAGNNKKASPQTVYDNWEDARINNEKLIKALSK